MIPPLCGLPLSMLSLGARMMLVRFSFGVVSVGAIGIGEGWCMCLNEFDVGFLLV